ncbi:MAG: hypothetical protein LBI06_08360, partial [Treponema sp.]|nr:hypothetical protein [Treponema sp.]
MKKFYWILVCLFVLLPQFAITQTFGIAQTYSRLSHGFNTRKITEKNGEKDYEYFIIDNDRYSNVLIKESWEESHIGSGVRYEIPYTRDSYLIITLRDGGDMGYPNLHPKGTPIRSSYTEDMLIQNFKDGSTIRYYNTSEDEIEHLYLTLFVKHMSIIINNFHLAMIDLPYKNIRLLPWYEDVYF